MGNQQLVDHGVNLLDIEYRRRMRIKHGCMIHVLALSLQDGFDDQFLNIHVGAHQGRELHRQLTDPRRLHTVVIDQTRHFDGAALWQIVDQIVVEHIAILEKRLPSVMAERSSLGLQRHAQEMKGEIMQAKERLRAK